MPALLTESVDMNDLDIIWANLVNAIESRGGYVHPSLRFVALTGPADHRGVITKEAIPSQTLLIRLQNQYWIDGSQHPATAQEGSPWLKCLLQYYYYHREQKDFAPYFDSLPISYDTLQHWSTQEWDYLKGTSLFSKDILIQERYRNQVRPILERHGLVPTSNEFQFFQNAVDCIATRGFHLQDRPFLLPLIDLLNHHTTRKCTTLQQTQENAFEMVAERTIQAGEEILHSYGDSLNSTQLLSTFGFIPTEHVQNAIQNQIRNASPVILHKKELLDTCFRIIESGIPQKIANEMEEQDIEDEIWEVKVDRSRKTDHVSEEIIVSADAPLPDELVTLCCIPFLPSCAYRETKDALLDSSIMEDYFLGRLISSTLIQHIQDSLSRYTAIEYDGQTKSDAEWLSQLINSTDPIRRLIFALTVRLEEKHCLQGLLDAVLDATGAMVDEDSSEKRQKIS